MCSGSTLCVKLHFDAGPFSFPILNISVRLVRFRFGVGWEVPNLLESGGRVWAGYPFRDHDPSSGVVTTPDVKYYCARIQYHSPV